MSSLPTVTEHDADQPPDHPYQLQFLVAMVGDEPLGLVAEEITRRPHYQRRPRRTVLPDHGVLPVRDTTQV
jgi:hypothetical protein